MLSDSAIDRESRASIRQSGRQARAATLVVHGGVDGDSRTGAVSVPIYQTSTFKQDGLGKMRGYEYARTGNPTREAVEALIADLEGARRGFAFASGMAAITAVLMLLHSGDEVLISSNVYGGTYRVLDRVFDSFGLRYRIVDSTDARAFDAAIGDETAAVLIESPANPLLAVTDIAQVAQVAHAKGVLLVVDNTFMSPYLQKPLALGADIVVHSATKYLAGHSDLVAGLVVTADEMLAHRLAFIQNSTGGVLGPADSWLLIRGIKTLAVRMDRHLENTGFIAQALRNTEGVQHVYWPGFADFPGHDIQARQATGYGAIISFELDPSYDTEVFFEALEVVTLAESLGGVESLVCHPATMTHAAIPREVREKVGITDGLIRLSVGIEAKEDIFADLRQAIGKASGTTGRPLPEQAPSAAPLQASGRAYVGDIRELVGHTPVLKLNHSGLPEEVEVFAKLEFWNPGGSIKDRMGIAMLEDAERRGQLHEGDTLIEVTAGNAGIGIALAALGRGYHVVFVVPEKFSQEKQDIMRALGATIVHTPSALGMQGAFDRADQLRRETPGMVELGQFRNPANPLVHYEQTGPEIWEQLEGRIDYIVAGAGSGGTLSGIARYLKERDASIEVVLADPYGSTMGGGEAGGYAIEGIGNTFMPETMDMGLVDSVQKVTDAEALAEVRLLAAREGILVGSSSGAALSAARKVAAQAADGARIVTVFPDRGDRYFSKHILVSEEVRQVSEHLAPVEGR